MERKSVLRTFVAGAVLTGLTSTPTLAWQEKSEPSVEDLQRQIDELRAQQEQLTDLQKQIDELKAEQGEDVGLRSSDTKLRLIGRLHLDAWGFPSTDAGINAIETGDPTQDPANNLEVRRARLGVQGTFYENMLYKAEIEYAKPDNFAFRDLYLGWSHLPAGQEVLLGNQKRPYGLDTLNSSNYNVFMERPFGVEAFNGSNRRPGVAAYGVTEQQRWNWRYGVFSMNDWATTGDVVANNIQPEIAARIAHTLWWKNDGRDFAHAALSGSYAWPDGDADTTRGDAPNEARFDTKPEADSQSRWIDTGRISGANHYGLLGLEGVVNMGPTQFTAEVQGAQVERTSASDTFFWGGYAYASYFLTGEHMSWNRSRGVLGRTKVRNPIGKGWGAWQLALRYSYADFSDEDVLGGEGQAVTFGLNWYWHDQASMQFNYLHGSIDDRETDVGGLPTVVDGDYDIIGVRFRIFF